MTKLVLVTKESAYRYRNDSVRIAKWQLATSLFFIFSFVTSTTYLISAVLNATPARPGVLEMTAAIVWLSIGLGVFIVVRYFAFNATRFPDDLVVTQAELEEMRELGVPDAMITDICNTTILWSQEELTANLLARDLFRKLGVKQ